MGHTLWGNTRKKMWGVLSSGGLKENKEDREYLFSRTTMAGFGLFHTDHRIPSTIT